MHAHKEGFVQKTKESEHVHEMIFHSQGLANLKISSVFVRCSTAQRERERESLLLSRSTSISRSGFSSTPTALHTFPICWFICLSCSCLSCSHSRVFLKLKSLDPFQKDPIAESGWSQNIRALSGRLERFVGIRNRLVRGSFEHFEHFQFEKNQKNSNKSSFKKPTSLAELLNTEVSCEKCREQPAPLKLIK